MNCKNIKNFMINWFQKDKKILGISLLAGTAVTIIFGTATKAYSDTIQSGISDSVVRFHVLANSDSEDDQELKLKVRDAVLEVMEKPLSMSQSIEETKEILDKNKNVMKTTALEVIHEQGYSYDVNVILSRDLFPYKEYGNVRFPAGEYDALRIEIGEAKGRNWWCVMFPPLCFVDAACGEMPEESQKQLKSMLSEEEYELVVSAKEQKDIVPEVKFKIVEWWQEKEASGSQYATKP